jgi:hypothetical protein
LEDQGSEWILGRLVWGVWIGFDWLRTGTSGVLLWVRWWIFGFLWYGVSYAETYQRPSTAPPIHQHTHTNLWQFATVGRHDNSLAKKKVLSFFNISALAVTNRAPRGEAPMVPGSGRLRGLRADVHLNCNHCTKYKNLTSIHYYNNIYFADRSDKEKAILKIVIRFLPTRHSVASWRRRRGWCKVMFWLLK